VNGEEISKKMRKLRRMKGEVELLKVGV